MPITKQVQIIDQKKLAAAALGLNKEAFVMYVAYLGAKISIYPAWEALISLLLAKKISVSAKYVEFLDVFFKEFAAVLLKR